MATNYSPAGQSGLAAKIQGLREVKAAFQALPAIVREAMLDEAITPTTSEVARQAKANLLSSPSVNTRALYNHVAFAVNRNNGRGRVGISAGTTTFRIAGKRISVKGIVRTGGAGGRARVDNPAARAKFIEFGTRKMQAEPFMIPAAESQKGPFLDRAKRAGKRVESDMAHVGGRFS